MEICGDGDLRHRVDKSHHDLVQPRQRLEQAEQAEEAKHPQERDVDAMPFEGGDDHHLAD